MEDKKFFAYAVIHKDGPMKRSFSYGTDYGGIRKAYDEIRTSSEAPNEAPPDEKDSGKSRNPPKESILDDIMSKAVEGLTSQFELVSMSQLMGSAAHILTLDKYVIDYANQAGELLEQDGATSLVGLSESAIRKLRTEMERVNRLQKGMEALPSALLMSIVATFDSNMSDIVRGMLGLKGASTNFGNKTVPITDVLQASSIESFREKILDNEIYLFSRGSHEEQVQYIENNFHISIIEHWKRWPDFIEIFERRNLIAHGERRFTQRYTSICEKNRHKGVAGQLGQPITLPSKYLYQALSILLEFSVLLVFSLWRKHVPDAESQAFGAVNDTSLTLIANGQSRVATQILSYAIKLKNSNCPEKIRRMMVINLASAYRHNKNEKGCLEALKLMEWSTASDEFRICVAALENNIDQACALLEIVRATKSIRKEYFREWPVFDFIRDDAQFQERFYEVFGEPLVSDDSIRKLELRDQNSAGTPAIETPSDQPPDDPKTLH